MARKAEAAAEAEAVAAAASIEAAAELYETSSSGEEDQRPDVADVARAFEATAQFADVLNQARADAASFRQLLTGQDDAASLRHASSNMPELVDRSPGSSMSSGLEPAGQEETQEEKRKMQRNV